ncbi:ParB/RepB/Spo0J family partition protein [Leptolyngbya sp. CCNP1308]|uniref:ParB/RepB/Spo0J family partition protein n=1 Tax=Leptolyngbya sp. CCNP1308 TaxID=3110255 RepID=UPI002B1FEE34|nr:ParB/RepB/Spo0J family partition protein [Leptolyngbya sp. CCNP1308]MEA5449639.1 ParB/RepB/Spo0J family partition protein [Leptolyngbya sp. CCNP1308]
MVVRRKPKSVDDFIAGSPNGADNTRSLDAELQQLRSEIQQLKMTSHAVEGIQQIAPDQLQPLSIANGLGQPRKYFNPAGMERLETSIRHKGIQEPLLIRKAEGGLQIVSGERRWRCAVNLQLDTVPCVVREFSDDEALEIALVANLMREDLNPIEETDNLIGLMELKLGQPREDIPGLLIQLKNARQRDTLDDDKSGLITQVEDVLTAFSIALDTFVSNRLPLLNLPPVLLDAVRQGNIEFSKAQLIARLPEDLQERTLESAIKEDLTKAALKEHIREVKVQAKDKPEDLPLRERIHSTYQKLRSKKAWNQLEQDADLKKRMEKLEVEMQRILEQLGD